MAEKTIALRADLVERLERIASAQGRSVDEVLDTLLESQIPPAPAGNWALTLAERMAAAPIDWKDEPELSARSRRLFQEDRYERWRRSHS